VDTKRCADLAIAHAAFAHIEDVGTELLFVRITEIAFG
jgi:hypothetical protein